MTENLDQSPTAHGSNFKDVLTAIAAPNGLDGKLTAITILPPMHIKLAELLESIPSGFTIKERKTY